MGFDPRVLSIIRAHTRAHFTLFGLDDLPSDERAFHKENIQPSRIRLANC